MEKLYVDDFYYNDNEITEQDQLHHQQFTNVENYHCVEFVAIPPDFDIHNFLGMREQAGIFDAKNINLKQLEVICEAVKASPVFTILNNTMMDPPTCMFFLKVVKDLGLIIKSIHNPLREHLDRYIRMFGERESNHTVYINGQNVVRLNITIVNIFQMLSEDVISEATEIAHKLQKEQEEVNKKLESIKL